MEKVLINLTSNAIGDTIAAIPYADRFRQDSGSHTIISVNDPLAKLVSDSYPELEVIGRNVSGYFDRVYELEYDYNLSVQGGYAKQLGYESPEYIRPTLAFEPGDRPIRGKYVALGVQSTAQLKYWNHPTGRSVQGLAPNFTELCRLLRKHGLTPIVVEKHESFGISPHFNGTPGKSNPKIGQSLEDSMNIIHNSEFYIGLSSGMAWVAHALGKRVAMIANFTEPWNEFDLSLPDYVRITDDSVCHGCWNRVNLDYSFDPGDWYWCPRHKGTPREFECSKVITPETVIDRIKHWF